MLWTVRYDIDGVWYVKISGIGTGKAKINSNKCQQWHICPMLMILENRLSNWDRQINSGPCRFLKNGPWIPSWLIPCQKYNRLRVSHQPAIYTMQWWDSPDKSSQCACSIKYGLRNNASHLVIMMLTHHSGAASPCWVVILRKQALITR